MNAYIMTDLRQSVGRVCVRALVVRPVWLLPIRGVSGSTAGTMDAVGGLAEFWGSTCRADLGSTLTLVCRFTIGEILAGRQEVDKITAKMEQYNRENELNVGGNDIHIVQLDMFSQENLKKHDVVTALVRLCGCLLGILRSVVNYYHLCKCPVCESLIYKLVPLLPALVQPGREEEASEILGEIEQFNTEDEKYGDLIEGVTKALVCLLWFSFFISVGARVPKQYAYNSSLKYWSLKRGHAFVRFKRKKSANFDSVLKQFVNIITDFRLWPNGTCVLRFSILMDDFRKFKCSECESQVYNLVPHSPVLIQPGRQVAEKDVDLLQSTLIQYADAVYDFRLWSNGMFLFASEGIEFRLCQMVRCAVLVLVSTVYSFWIDMIMD
ncbi:hypothetical protein SASPL_138800 [Salvia splendens]|uniref:Uncharacterized protein n=1 Tax=Salvia splendens TaxID=180675 RepID=A0A8X8WW53_SALSN|nr:hypothetical protein SASPL_138800 [Salvia splendens]